MREEEEEAERERGEEWGGEEREHQRYKLTDDTKLCPFRLVPCISKTRETTWDRLADEVLDEGHDNDHGNDSFRLHISPFFCQEETNRIHQEHSSYLGEVRRHCNHKLEKT